MINTNSQVARAPFHLDGDHGHADIADVRRHSRQRVDLAVETGQQRRGRPRNT